MFGMKLLELYPDFCSFKHHPAKLSAYERQAAATGVFARHEWADLWNDAQMVDVVQYLIGNKHCHLPGHWREQFPSEL